MIKTFCTELVAIHPVTKNLCVFQGQFIKAVSFEAAQEYCNKNGLGYLLVTGIAESEIPTDENGNPDYTKEVKLKKIN